MFLAIPELALNLHEAFYFKIYKKFNTIYLFSSLGSFPSSPIFYSIALKILKEVSFNTLLFTLNCLSQNSIISGLMHVKRQTEKFSSFTNRFKNNKTKLNFFTSNLFLLLSLFYSVNLFYFFLYFFDYFSLAFSFSGSFSYSFS
jgi:hypothetical protein